MLMIEVIEQAGLDPSDYIIREIDKNERFDYENLEYKLGIRFFLKKWFQDTDYVWKTKIIGRYRNLEDLKRSLAKIKKNENS